MTRHEKHRAQLATVHRKLHRHGCRDIHRMPHRLPFDFECRTAKGPLRVTVRVSHSRVRPHRVRVHGKTYTYRYPEWFFNFHHHGKFDEQYTDVFVLIAQPLHGVDDGAVFVVPWEAVTAKTFTSHNLRGYKGQYSRYRNAWSILGA